MAHMLFSAVSESVFTQEKPGRQLILAKRNRNFIALSTKFRFEADCD